MSFYQELFCLLIGKNVNFIHSFYRSLADLIQHFYHLKIIYMKKLFFLCTAFLMFSFTSMSPTLSDKERKDAIDLLSKTELGVFNSLKGLSEAQLNFKPAPDKW